MGFLEGGGEESVWIGEDHSEGFEEVGRKGGCEGVVDDCLGTASGTAFLSFAFPASFSLFSFVFFLLQHVCLSFSFFSNHRWGAIFIGNFFAFPLCFLSFFLGSSVSISNNPLCSFAHLTFVFLIYIFLLLGSGCGKLSVVLVWFGFLPSFTLGYYFFSFLFFSLFLALIVRFFLRACFASPRVGSGTRVGVGCCM